MVSTVSAAKFFDVLRFRRRAYQLCFGSPAEVFRLWRVGIRQAYSAIFLQPAGQEVLIDLAKFCRANESCFDADPRITAALEGRREVFLRITQHLGLTSEQLFALYTGEQFSTGDRQ